MSTERELFRRGEQIYILPQYQDAGDDRFEWRVIDDEGKGRVTISPVDCGLAITPSQVVGVEMISRTPAK